VKLDDVIDRQVAAYNAQQVVECVDCFAEDAVIIRDTDGSETRAREALRNFYADLFRKYPRNRATILKRMIVGEHLVDEELIEGREKPFRTIVVYLIRNGLIQQARSLSRDETVPPVAVR
jgi:hypothetical protein